MTQGGDSVQLVITLKPDGVVNVEGPLENKVFCLGLMELAKDAIYKYRPGPINRVPADLLKHLAPK